MNITSDAANTHRDSTALWPTRPCIPACCINEETPATTPLPRSGRPSAANASPHDRHRTDTRVVCHITDERVTIGGG